MNPTKNLIEPKPYMNPTKNLIEAKLVFDGLGCFPFHYGR